MNPSMNVTVHLWACLSLIRNIGLNFQIFVPPKHRYIYNLVISRWGNSDFLFIVNFNEQQMNTSYCRSFITSTNHIGNNFIIIIQPLTPLYSIHAYLLATDTSIYLYN